MGEESLNDLQKVITTALRNITTPFGSFLSSCPTITREDRLYTINEFLTPFNVQVQNVAEKIHRKCSSKQACIRKTFNFVSTQIQYGEDKQSYDLFFVIPRITELKEENYYYC